MKNWFKKVWDDIKLWVFGILAIIFVGSIVFAYVAYEYGIWHECLRDHSWFYCHRIL